MLLKVMLILGLILLGTWLARIYPGQDRNSEDDEWEDAPPQVHGRARASSQGKAASITCGRRQSCRSTRSVIPVSIVKLCHRAL